MSNTINIIQIIGKHSPLIAAGMEHDQSITMNPSALEAAIKEIVEAVIDKCAEEAEVRRYEVAYDVRCGINKDSIRKVKDMINYE